VTDGLVVVDKPAGWTSHDVVARCRRIFGQRRVGHAGTLDPDATGVLLVGLGRATRLLRYLSGLGKTYTGDLVLGVATTTLDASGQETGRWDMSSVTLADARAAARGLTGSILQVPPMVSALKVGGRRLHELARAGEEVERKARPVRVGCFDLAVSETAAASDPPAALGGKPAFSFTVECSSGTYVRTLVADLGAALGGGAYLRTLRRRAVGDWSESEAVPLERLGPEHVLEMARTVGHLDQVTVGAEEAAAVAHGKVLSLEALGVRGGGPWAVRDAGGGLLAVYEAYGDGRSKPAVVVATGGAEPDDRPGGVDWAGPAGGSQ
jgi:tRNA pseudouridine55 synthase